MTVNYDDIDWVARMGKHVLPAENGCTRWRSGGGLHYPSFSYKGKVMPASRALWLMLYGSIPADAFVMHKCDNVDCLNPGHLKLGTHKENMQDMAMKGRARGLFHNEEFLLRLLSALERPK